VVNAVAAGQEQVIIVSAFLGYTIGFPFAVDYIFVGKYK
jgi:hypothetical protein